MAKIRKKTPRQIIPELKNNLPQDFRVDGEKVYLRPVRIEDATLKYCSWLNSPAVNKFTESRYQKTTLSDLKKYVGAALRSPSNFFFAIIEKFSDEHIGNIKIDSIITPFWDHKVGEVGLIIGEKKCWGKGYATEAIRLMGRFAFDHLKLHKLTATCYANNAGSCKAFLRAGYAQEGIRPLQARCKGKYVDLLLFGVINPRCKKS